MGIAAAAAAATLSGFAGVYLEFMFLHGSASLWARLHTRHTPPSDSAATHPLTPHPSRRCRQVRNVQLGLFGVPLQALAVWQHEAAHVRRHGLLRGFRRSTWAVVLIQARSRRDSSTEARG